MRLHFFNSAVTANSKMDYWPVALMIVSKRDTKVIITGKSAFDPWILYFAL